ncbi:hypothetical protein V1517DRAFT_313746 [Lipomyces orientalis]|uniref:Uncharacterized protein n=1 Tax=Lipomyces orientalis TaxID=1233043 RepID=A0ACC3TWL3_9ASCO
MSLAMGASDQTPPTSPEQASPVPPAKRSWRESLTPERKRLYRNFLFATTATYLSVMITKRAIISRRHVPSLFHHNNYVPQFNKYQDGIQAVTLGTLLSCSTFAMGVTGVALVFNINNPYEFHAAMRNYMRGLGLQTELSKELEKNVDPRVKEIEDAIENFLSDSFPDDTPDAKGEKKN